ncbi:MAG: hypothetical protein PHH59_13305 [Methylovulum sp.]|uniref:hypothetical protein n=1 Tax=Methylovulum sp. TaxID=1916980 RepID=UPI002605F566|nr:hypothetical protein [Methylovulum sp.]MDD2724982.1 hypothetical protein [Methylovulum sp.]MDD5126167.1 hypothetical protein [Methylovulum sp.]
MLKILWVEDEYSEQKQVSWFNNRSVCVKTSFDEAENAINHCLTQFDLIVLDINLENSEHTDRVKALAKQFKISEQAFLQESGMNLFLNLLEHGFPKDQIIFLTANADINISRIDELREFYRQGDDDAFNEILGAITNGLSEETVIKCAELIKAEDIEGLCQYLENYFNKLNDGVTNNTYNRFCEAYRRCRIEPPKAINKSLNEAKHHLNHWLENHERNDYLVLRRGVIEACSFLKSHIEKNEDTIQFRDFIKIENQQPTIEIPTADIGNYLETLAQFLPLKQSDDPIIFYRLFLRTLVHEWEENIEAKWLKEKHGNDLSKIRDIYTFAWLMKMTRNWVSHANLLEPLKPQFIAFLFLVNMRAMFKLTKAIQPYEKILLRCISLSPTNSIIPKELQDYVSGVEKDIDGILTGLKLDQTGHFGEKINAIYRQNTGNPDAEPHDYQKFLLHYFWVNQKADLIHLTATSDEFLPTLARHIYNRSFP